MLPPPLVGWEPFPFVRFVVGAGCLLSEPPLVPLFAAIVTVAPVFGCEELTGSVVVFGEDEEPPQAATAAAQTTAVAPPANAWTLRRRLRGCSDGVSSWNAIHIQNERLRPDLSRL